MAIKELLPRLQKTWLFAWIMALALGLGYINNALDGWDKLLVLVGIKPDALALAESVNKADFSREFTEVAWRRLSCSRMFLARVDQEAPQSEIDEAWRTYISASEIWNTRIMYYIVATERFYGKDKSHELEGRVQYSLNHMSNSLIDLRYSNKKDKILQNMARKNIDNANRCLYKFVRSIESL